MLARNLESDAVPLFDWDPRASMHQSSSLSSMAPAVAMASSIFERSCFASLTVLSSIVS